MTASTASRRWSPPSPAIMASSRTCSASGSIPSAPPRGRSLSDRARRSGASTAGPYALADLPPVRPCLSARASKPCYLWSPPSTAFLPHRLFRRAVTAPSKPPQDLALLVIARDKDMEDEQAANRLQRRCRERGIPSIVIVPEHSDFNDDLIAFGEETLTARIAPLIASTSPRQRWKRGVGVGE